MEQDSLVISCLLLLMLTNSVSKKDHKQEQTALTSSCEKEICQNTNHMHLSSTTTVRTRTMFDRLKLFSVVTVISGWG